MSVQTNPRKEFKTKAMHGMRQAINGGVCVDLLTLNVIATTCAQKPTTNGVFV